MLHCHEGFVVGGALLLGLSKRPCSKGVFVIANPICANIHLSFPFGICSDDVVSVAASLMGLHGLFVRNSATENRHKHFLCAPDESGRLAS
jgi:hypothetical protein